jgi:hypothetical protein
MKKQSIFCHCGLDPQSPAKNTAPLMGLRVKPAMTKSLFLALVFCLTSCVKEPLYETDHPDHGRIISLTTDWSNRGEGINIPTNYSLKVGDYTTTLAGTTNEVNNYFLVGVYPVNVWNLATNISVSGNTATAVYPLPFGEEARGEAFFTGSQEVTIEKDKDYAFTVSMRQQVRQLTLVLEAAGSAKDKITAVDATLSGVAGAINIDNGNPIGNAVTVSPVFTKQSDGIYTATLILLGITGNAQTLTVTLSFTAGNPSNVTIPCDLSEPLAAFNAEKKTPLALSATIVVTPTEAGFSATIADWTSSGENIIAD